MKCTKVSFQRSPQAWLRSAAQTPPPAQLPPWLQNVTVDVPARQHTVPELLRPLIYVYDLPAEYHSRMVQYRVVKVLPTSKAFPHPACRRV